MIELFIFAAIIMPVISLVNMYRSIKESMSERTFSETQLKTMLAEAEIKMTLHNEGCKLYANACQKLSSHFYVFENVIIDHENAKMLSIYRDYVSKSILDTATFRRFIVDHGSAKTLVEFDKLDFEVVNQLRKIYNDYDLANRYSVILQYEHLKGMESSIKPKSLRRNVYSKRHC